MNSIEHSPYYCGFCKCDPCECDGHGNFDVSDSKPQVTYQAWYAWYQAEKEKEEKKKVD